MLNVIEKLLLMEYSNCVDKETIEFFDLIKD